uniref:hypothetical protein n=1 Tax=Hypnea brasiliensis TaxID=1866962 RepID=UPI0023F4E84F|nr:hypothetical protein P8481_pgp017 [Hypnea brasiliensis]WCH55349.1 hypothetical protein [Hypnea brasiliensis]WDY84855.1 hypothetical protein [Hypnea brasiliensis]
MFAPKNICPVPFDQQPLNEYLALKKSCFFAWSVLSLNKYINTVFSIFILSLILIIPVIWIMFYNKIGLLYILFYSVLSVNIVFILLFIRLYLGWSYIVNRLLSATVFYEESGWYDGQIWIKTPDILTKDRLIGLYEINPYIKRIKYSLFLCFFLFILELIILYLI